MKHVCTTCGTASLFRTPCKVCWTSRKPLKTPREVTQAIHASTAHARAVRSERVRLRDSQAVQAMAEAATGEIIAAIARRQG